MVVQWISCNVTPKCCPFIETLRFPFERFHVPTDNNSLYHRQWTYNTPSHHQLFTDSEPHVVNGLTSHLYVTVIRPWVVSILIPIHAVANSRFDASLMPLSMVFGMKPSISAAASEHWRSSTVTKPSPGWNYPSQSIIGNRRILARWLLRCMSAIVYTPVTVFEALSHRAVYSKSQITTWLTQS